jgi:hypothetical protein
MNIFVNFITGCMVGLEFYNDEFLGGWGIIIDLTIIRIIVDFE